MVSTTLARGAKFSCGLLELENANVEPDWDEFKERIDFVREVRDLHVTFLEAFKDGEAWEVPFFSAQAELNREDVPKMLLEQNTPYRVLGYKVLEPANVDVDTLRILKNLVNGEMPSTWLSAVKPKVDKANVTSPEEVFAGLVGMEAQKGRLMKLAKTVATCGKESIDCFHLVFTGNPGTGKTELASRLVKYLDLLGITDGIGRFVKVGEADLVGKYVGHTAPRVKAVVESALGGLLFIDEFYSLASAPYFGQEALDALTDQLDARRHDFVCVVAGYKKEVEDTLSLNRGLRDRFGYHIEFPDYTAEQLIELFKMFAGQRGFSTDCEDAVVAAMERLRAFEGFSNARSVRRLVDHAVCEACWNHEKDRSIRAEDLQQALIQCTSTSVRRRAGF